MTLCDTGILVNLAGFNTKMAEVAAKAVSTAKRPLITTWPCIAESMHLLGKRGGGWNKQYQLARLIQSPLILIYDIEPADFSRLFELMAKYQDKPMDLADASLVLVAEKTGNQQILTIDSDFFIYRINDRDSFDVLDL